nr:hypothetical protein [Streptococcus pseudopneumoniae]
MPQPIVPVEIPQSRRFDSKKRNDILLKVQQKVIIWKIRKMFVS